MAAVECRRTRTGAEPRRRRLKTRDAAASGQAELVEANPRTRKPLGTLCITLAALWHADRGGPQAVFLQPIAPLLARKTTQRTARARVITACRKLCRGLLEQRRGRGSLRALMRLPVTTPVLAAGLGQSAAFVLLPASERLVAKRRPAAHPLANRAFFHRAACQRPSCSSTRIAA